MERKTLKVIKQAAEKAGVEFVEAHEAGRHIKAYFRKDGVTRFVTVSISNNDWNKHLYIAKDIRKVFANE